jgi:hypothetical protein
MKHREQLKLLFINRYRRKGYAMPILVYTDNCCKDREFLHHLIEELKQLDAKFEVQLGAVSPQTDVPLPQLEFPAMSEPKHVLASEMHINALNTICDAIRTRAQDSNRIAGFDIEYNPIFIPSADGATIAPATIQIAFENGESWVFSLFKNGIKQDNIPQALAVLLTDDSITFVGEAQILHIESKTEVEL